MAAKPLLRVLAGETPARPPFWLMRQAGRYLPEYRAARARAPDFVTLCLTPDLAAEITLQPVRRFAPDAAILFADILLVPHALGRTVTFVEGEGPRFVPLRPDGLDAMAAALPGLRAALAPVAATVRLVAAGLPEATTLIGFAGAPWTVATYLIEGGSSRDFAAAKAFAWREPEAFARLIDLLTEATIDYLAMQVEAGAETVQIFDSWAGALDAAGFRRWSVAPAKRIAAAMAARGVRTIGFPRGAGAGYELFAAAGGCAGVGIDSSVPPAWARDTLQKRVAVQGNLDPVLLVAGGEALHAAARELLETLGRGPFVFNLGHGVRPETPLAHVEALCAQLHAWTGA